VCFSFLLLSCNKRNTAEVEEPIIPIGEKFFNPNWELTEELDGYEVTTLQLSFNNYLIAATSRGNLFRSKTNGNNWIIAPAGNNAVTTIHLSNNNFMYAGTKSGEIYYSNTNGRTWNLLEIFGHRINAIITAYDSSLILGTLSGLFRSEDNAETWNPVTNGISPYSKIYSLIIPRSGKILAGTSDGLYFSQDNGTSWEKSDFSEVCYCFARSYNSALFAGTANGIFRSSDNGNNWIQTGFANEKIISLSVSKEINIFAGLNGKGIFYSPNNGYSWMSFGLDNKTVNAILDVWYQDMVFASAGNKVYRITAVK
jgi:photosystem II stability/assembly factor-like uncharacterized protein